MKWLCPPPPLETLYAKGSRQFFEGWGEGEAAFVTPFKLCNVHIMFERTEGGKKVAFVLPLELCVPLPPSWKPP